MMKLYPNHLCAAVAVLLSLATFDLAAQQAGGGRTTRGAGSRSYPGTGAIGDAYFSIDPETRRVVTIADEETAAYIQEVLQHLDRPKPQVLIKVVFLEVTHNRDSDIGIEGGFKKNIDNNTTANGANVFGLSGLGSLSGSNGLPLNALGQPIRSFNPTPPGAGLYQILGQDYQVTIRAIAQAGNAKVLSRPSILARNNQPATIKVGQTVPLITAVRYDNFGNAINSVSYEDVGVILRVTPFITDDGMVEMIIAPEISSIDPTLTIPISADVSAPVINVRAADTVAVTPDGQTVIIGGLMSALKAKADSKIPVLGDIPLLGNLFKRRTRSEQNSELLIFLTPHIVAAPSELAAVSEREKKSGYTPGAFSDQELNRFLDTLPPSGEPFDAPPKKNGKK